MFMWKLREELPSEFSVPDPNIVLWALHSYLLSYIVVFISCIYLCTVCHWGCWAANSYVLASYLQELWSPSGSALPSPSCAGRPPPFPAPLEADPCTMSTLNHYRYSYAQHLSVWTFSRAKLHVMHTPWICKVMHQKLLKTLGPKQPTWDTVWFKKWW
jgi:hypothetical protein